MTVTDSRAMLFSLELLVEIAAENRTDPVPSLPGSVQADAETDQSVTASNSTGVVEKFAPSGRGGVATSSTVDCSLSRTAAALVR